MILISKVRTSASKKINVMALIRTLTISTITFERMKEKFDGFRQTDLVRNYFGSFSHKKAKISPGGETFNLEVIGMLVGNFLENPKNTQILILNP